MAIRQAPQDGRGPRRLRPGRRRRARRRPVDDDDRHGRCGGDGAAVHRAGRSRAPRWCASPSTCPKPPPPCPRSSSACSTPASTAPLIGDFHYNGHLLLTRYPDCAEALDKYRINPGNVGTGKRRDEQFATICRRRARPRQAGAHRRQRRLAQSGAGHRARCRRTPTATSG